MKPPLIRDAGARLSRLNVSPARNQEIDSSPGALASRLIASDGIA